MTEKSVATMIESRMVENLVTRPLQVGKELFDCPWLMLGLGDDDELPQVYLPLLCPDCGRAMHFDPEILDEFGDRIVTYDLVSIDLIPQVDMETIQKFSYNMGFEIDPGIAFHSSQDVFPAVLLWFEKYAIDIDLTDDEAFDHNPGEGTEFNDMDDWDEEPEDDFALVTHPFSLIYACFSDPDGWDADNPFRL